MNTSIPTREDALALLKQYNKKESLIRHAVAVEAVMGYFAEKYNEDIEKYKIIGLLHDIDYDMFPDQHCVKAVEILEENLWPQEYIRAIVSHGWGLCTDIKPETLLEKTLYAVDELTGLVASAALVRPSKSILDITAKSVKKKWRDKSFAAGVDRSVIEKGADMLQIDLTELITDVIMGMRTVAEQIGLKGNL